MGFERNEENGRIKVSPQLCCAVKWCKIPSKRGEPARPVAGDTSKHNLLKCLCADGSWGWQTIRAKTKQENCPNLHSDSLHVFCEVRQFHLKSFFSSTLHYLLLTHLPYPQPWCHPSFPLLRLPVEEPTHPGRPPKDLTGGDFAASGHSPPPGPEHEHEYSAAGDDHPSWLRWHGAQSTRRAEVSRRGKKFTVSRILETGATAFPKGTRWVELIKSWMKICFRGMGNQIGKDEV